MQEEAKGPPLYHASRVTVFLSGELFARSPENLPVPVHRSPSPITGSDHPCQFCLWSLPRIAICGAAFFLCSRECSLIGPFIPCRLSSSGPVQGKCAFSGLMLVYSLGTSLNMCDLAWSRSGRLSSGPFGIVCSLFSASGWLRSRGWFRSILQHPKRIDLGDIVGFSLKIIVSGNAVEVESENDT